MAWADATADAAVGALPMKPPASSTALRAIVTRPQPQAAQWVAQLVAAGIEAVALPLIDIAPPEDADAVVVAWAGIDRHRLVFFVSPAAVERWFACQPASRAWPRDTRAAASGPGTARALLAAGVPAAAVAAPPADASQFDSEALWQVLAPRDWRGASVLVVRGEGGRDWLADRLLAAGAQVHFVAAYRRTAPRIVPGSASAAVLAAACAAPSSHCWLFSSSQAIDHLAAVQPAAPPWQHARALATHPRIGERARRAGFGRVVLARPTLAAVVACLQSERNPIAP